jgi:GNAT superfamily N-acetyltransferase
MVQVIKAGPEDFETIHALAEKVWPQTYKSILSEEQVEYMFGMMYSREAFTEQVGLKNHHFLLAKGDNEYLGFASYECNYSTGVTKIHKLYVLPETQGKGVGRAMVTAIVNIAKKNGNSIISLNVNRYNKAVHFYEAIGFTKAGQEDIDIGQGYLMEDYIMQKEV